MSAKRAPKTALIISEQNQELCSESDDSEVQEISRRRWPIAPSASPQDPLGLISGLSVVRFYLSRQTRHEACSADIPERVPININTKLSATESDWHASATLREIQRSMPGVTTEGDFDFELTAGKIHELEKIIHQASSRSFRFPRGRDLSCPSERRLWKQLVKIDGNAVAQSWNCTSGNSALVSG